MFKGTTLRIGDKVKHRTRPNIGIGEIVEITEDDLCTVEFSNSKFSGIPLDAFGSIDELEKITCESEQKARNEQILIEKNEIARTRAKEEEAKHQHALEEQKRREKIKEQDRARESSNRKIVDQFTRKRAGSLWHITHKENLQHILRYGILNHYDACRIAPNRVDISDPDAQRWREAIEPHYKRRIHDYAPLYVRPRNPMLYVRRHLRNDLFLIEIDLSVLFDSEYLLADGNAASHATKFYKSVEHIDELPWAVLNGGYWPDHKDGKRKMCAEVLVYPKVAPSYIVAIHTYSPHSKSFVSNCEHKVKISPDLFF